MNNFFKSLFPPIKRNTLAHYTFVFILLLGLFLRFYQYLMGRSLWEDEAHLALNFIYSGYVDLMRPLAHFQAVPIFFLFSVETISLVFGFSEYALRFFPFFVSIVTFPLFYYVVLELTKNKMTALISFCFYALNLALIYFSSELKTYTIDVAAFILMSYLILTEHRFIKKRRNSLLTIAGCLTVFYSSVSPIILACIACYKIYEWYITKTFKKSDFTLFINWTLAFLINFFLFIYKHPYANAMKQEWAFTFCPINIWSKDFLSFGESTINSIFFQLLTIDKAKISLYCILLISVTGLISLFRRKQYDILIFSFLPILVHLALSAFKLYPFYYRFILYLVPGLILIISIGITTIINFISRKVHIYISTAFFAFIFYLLVSSNIRQFPLWFREVKPSLNYMKENYPHSRIYVTTPFTLYKYYLLTHYVNDTSFVALEWNITPEKYYELVKNQQSNYLLFHATDFAVDGYKDVMNDLKKRGLIVKEFEYKTYTVSEIKPLPKTN